MSEPIGTIIVFCCEIAISQLSKGYILRTIELSRYINEDLNSNIRNIALKVLLYSKKNLFVKH
jgi:hypothetical protein